jgi:hypothetical protein
MKNVLIAIFSILALSGCVTVKDVNESFQVHDLILEYHNQHGEWPKSKSELIDFAEQENLNYNKRYYSLNFVPLEKKMLKVEYSKGLFGKRGSFTISPASKVIGNHPFELSDPSFEKESQPDGIVNASASRD